MRILLWLTLALPVAAAAQPPRAIVEIEATPSQPYVGQQVVVTARLLVAENVLSSGLSDPRCDGAILRPLEDDAVISRTTRAGASYDVFERRYALFALRSGALRIEAPVFRGGFSLQPGPRMPFGGHLPAGAVRDLVVTARALALAVSAPPVATADWLPASRVELREELGSTDGALQVGEPFVRSIELIADGQLHTRIVIPEIGIPAGLKSFPDAPEAATTNEAHGVVARWRQRWALVPEREGDFTLPEIRVAWWDVADKRAKVAAIAARTITVRAAALRDDATGPAVARASPAPPVWQWLAGAAFLGWIVTALAWWRAHRRGVPRPPANAAASPGGARSALQRELRERNPAGARVAVLLWARARFGDETIRGLAAVAAAARSDELRRQLRALDRALYGRAATWHPEALAAAIDSVGAMAPASRTPAALMPLYPGDSEPAEPMGRQMPARRATVVAAALALLAAAGFVFNDGDEKVPISADGYRALIARQEPGVLEFLREFERVQNELHPRRAGEQQRALTERFGNRLASLDEELRALEPAAELAPFHARWTAAIAGLDEAYREFGGARETDFVPAFFRSRRAFVAAVFELYDLRSDTPVLRDYWLLADVQPRWRDFESVAPPPAPTGLLHHAATDAHGPYSLYVPETYDPSRSWPLLVALHGSHGDGRGTLATWLRAAKSRGWIVLAPKSLDDSWGIDDPAADLDSIMAAVRELHSRYRIAGQRIFVTGLSDGGTFSYVLGMRCPDFFAGIAPVAGVLPPIDVAAAGRLPVLIVHGSDDWMFPVEQASHAYETLTADGFANVSLSVVPGWGHALNYDVNERFVLPWLEKTMRDSRAGGSCDGLAAVPPA